MINIELFREYLNQNKNEVKNIMSEIIVLFQKLADYLKNNN
jgi:hypothetical protein